MRPIDSSVPLLLRSIAVACMTLLIVLALPARAADFLINNEADLRAALNPGTGAQNGDTITFNANVTLTADLPAVQNSVTIIGGSHTLSGNNTYRGLLVYSGTIAIQDLSITNAVASGGNGGNGGNGGAGFTPGATAGGGGAGLGGAIFVAQGANVTVANVSLTGNTAAGGASGGIGAGSNNPGGGGGMGGNGGDGGVAGNGGGGGLGVGAN
ncbi:MAG: hypothetical protein IH605_19530, partial [Burkholderiales bacterium]|nr:hypothetical protein [Burkholderiales bacterium]